MKQKYFWNKKWFWISLTSLAIVGTATFISVSNYGKIFSQKNWHKSQFADRTDLGSTPDPKTLSGYGYHASRMSSYVSWAADVTSQKIVDVFPTLTIATAILRSLQNSDSTKFPVATSSISSDFSKADLAKIKSLSLANLGLSNIDEIFNPALVWSSLVSIELSNNDFKDYVLKFEKTQMPKLYSIIARNTNLNEMVDVSSYVTDPFDQAGADTTNYTTAKKEYAKALNKNVPRYFDLFQNNIRQIPKYYLKIALASFNLGSNKLGSGTVADPQGVYGIPWYSMEQSTNTSTIGIADSASRGPYGINLYNTGEKTNGSYKYSDEIVARWRAQPYPIKGLRFEQYNLTANSSGALDHGVIFSTTDDNKASGGTDPFFNFAGNNLVNIPIFRQGNVKYDSSSATAPQNKTVPVFAGLNNYKKSKIYTTATGSKPEMLTPQPDMIYPIIATWSWFNEPQNDTYFDQAMQGLYYPRSFNGFDRFAIAQDSRTGNSDWDNAVLKGQIGSFSDNVAKWNIPVASNFSNWNSLLESGIFGTQGTQGNLSFTNTSSSNFYKKWTALRSFILSPKTFAKKSYSEKWSDPDSTVDGNLFWDTNLGDGIRADSWKSPWSGAQNSDTLLPSGKKGSIWYFQTLTGHDASPRRDGPGSSSQFLGVGLGGSKVNKAYLLGFGQPAYFSNINNPSDYGTLQATTTPYTQGLTITAPGYNYDTSYEVVDEIKSNFKDTSSFPKNLDVTDGFDLATKYKKDNRPFFAEQITVNDIKEGLNTFWKSDSQFDQAYMNTLNPDQIKIKTSDLAAGKLTYSFRVYSPGYSALGRLFKDGDGTTSTDNNNSPTLDFEVTNTITGFAIPQFQMKAATGNDFVDVLTTGEKVVNNVFTQKAPADFLSAVGSTTITGDKNDQELKSKIAKQFQTTYLGNDPTDAENNQGVAKALNSKFVEITNINNSDGTISFKVNVPDYVFVNGNKLVFPEKYKNLTFTWTSLPVAQITIKGNNVADASNPGLSFTTFDPSSITAIKNKAASEITAQDLVDSNVIQSSRSDWVAIKTKPDNFSQYFQLNPENATGTLNWTLRLPGDDNQRNDGLSPLTVVVGWSQLLNQSTVITWKTSSNPSPNLKTHDVLLQEIKTSPSNYLAISNGHKNSSDTSAFTAEDFDFSKIQTSLNNSQDSIQISGIKLKSYYLNGVWIDGTKSDSSTTGLLVPEHTLVTQKPLYQATYKADTENQGHEAIWNSATLYYNKNINDTTIVSTPNKDLVKKLSSSEIKQLLVNNNVSPLQNVLKITTKPATANFSFPEADLLYKNNKLSDSLVADPLTGTLTFQDLTAKNWINNNSNTPVASHALNSQTYKFPKLSNKWKWADKIPWQISNLSFNVLASDFRNSESAKKIIDYFNVGQKYYDNDGILKNVYTVDPNLVILNPYLGTLTFKPNAISVSNWVSDGKVSEAPYKITEEKVYTFTNKLETQFFANEHLTKGVNAAISNWVRVVKNDNYDSLSDTKKAEYLAEFQTMQMPNYENVAAEQAISLTNRYLNSHSLRKINSEDLAVINDLKIKVEDFKDLDFKDYFYVPKYLLFLSSFDDNDNSGNRTYAIAQNIQSTSLTTSFQLSNIYIINYYKNGAKTIKKIPNILFTGFLSAVSTVIFNEDEKNSNTNALATAWHHLSATKIKERLEYLTTNRNNVAVNGTDNYKKIQSEWLSTFKFNNIPYGGVKDPGIVYPMNIVADDYSRTLIVNQLLFPYFSQTISADNPSSLVFDHLVNDPQIWLAKVGLDSFIQAVANFNEDRFQKIPSFFLKSLNLNQGEQDDGVATWTKLVSANIYQLVGNQPPVNNLGTSQTPSISIGKITVNDQKGTILFENVKGTHVWVDGKQEENKAFPSLTLDLGLKSTSLLRNSNSVVENWLSSTINSSDSSVSNLLIEFNQRILDNKFSLNDFNQMLNNSHAFFSILSPGDGSDTKIQVAANLKPADAFHLNIVTGEVSFHNLEIVNGYLDNIKVANQPIKQKLVFNLGWNYTTKFQENFENLLLEKKLFRSNTNHAASVLMQNPQQLLQHLNFNQLEGQLEAPIITVNSNPVLGHLTFNVHFKNFYKNGVNFGSRDFSYVFSDFEQTLPAIIGGTFSAIGAIILILVGWYIFHRIKNKDQIMLKATKKAKVSE